MQELMSDHAGRHKLSDFVLRYHHTAHILKMGETRFRKDYCKWAEKKGYGASPLQYRKRYGAG